MIKVLKKSTFDAMRSELTDTKHALTTEKAVNAAIRKTAEQNEEEFLQEKTQLEEKINTLQSEVDRLNGIMNNNDNNYVKILISKDLESITPVIAFREDCFEHMFQAGMLDDTKEGSKFAIQLALLTIAAESMQQLVESFETAPEEV